MTHDDYFTGEFEREWNKAMGLDEEVKDTGECCVSFMWCIWFMSTCVNLSVLDYFQLMT